MISLTLVVEERDNPIYFGYISNGKRLLLAKRKFLIVVLFYVVVMFKRS